MASSPMRTPDELADMTDAALERHYKMAVFQYRLIQQEITRLEARATEYGVQVSTAAIETNIRSRAKKNAK